MKKIFRNIIFSCLVIFLAGMTTEVNAQTKNLEEFKVMSWNIWNGFGSAPNKNCLNDFVSFIQKEDPDVLCLVEMCGYNEEKLTKLAARYGHKYVSILVGDSHPVAITSKAPMEKVFKQIKGYGHGMVHCKVNGIDFIGTHLTPGDEQPERRLKRKQEMDNIVKYIHDNQLDSCVVMGDLNSLSPFDAKVGERDLGRFTAISTLMAASLHDVMYFFNSDKDRTTFPTQIKRYDDKPKIIRYEQTRLDYFFLTDALFTKCTEAVIYRGKDVERISDHLPIGMTMLLEKK